jgi:osmotically-inducible protein OsmY
VSRANLLQAVASARRLLEITPSDKAIRERILSSLRAEPWAHTGLLNVTVSDGIVDLWGVAESDSERKAIKVAAESTPGVRAVNDNLATLVGGGWA